LSLMINIVEGINVYPKIIEKHLNDELPFMATENILMYCVKQGGNRQALHERIRLHSMEAANRIKLDGGENDLISRILSDANFNLRKKELDEILQAEQFTGRTMKQTEEFLSEVQHILDANKEFIGISVNVMI
ncbi:MAG: adenylosuccinate lyase, partial [Clostridiales bacterium]|nr:adenylosuccinate lyase [Clostridiales bacterium]